MSPRLFSLLLFLSIAILFAWNEFHHTVTGTPKPRPLKQEFVGFTIDRGGIWGPGVADGDLYYSGMPTDSTYVLLLVNKENWVIPTWFKIGESEIVIWKNKYKVLWVTPECIELRMLY
jgi:hypothetical protein